MSDQMKFTDIELIEAFRSSGDLALVSQLMDRHREAITGMAYNYLKDREEVQDFAQELFIRLRDKLEKAEIRNPRSWLLTVVRNMLVDKFRSKATRKEVLTEQLVERGEWDGEGNEKESMFKQLESEIEGLSEQEQFVIDRIYLKSESYAKISEETGMTFNQIRGYRDRAIAKLRTRMRPNISP